MPRMRKRARRISGKLICRCGGMVDTRDLKSLAGLLRTGSSPVTGTASERVSTVPFPSIRRKLHCVRRSKRRSVSVCSTKTALCQLLLHFQIEPAALGFNSVVTYETYTIGSSAAAGGVRSTDGVVFPFQIKPTALGFDLVFCCKRLMSFMNCVSSFFLFRIEPTALGFNSAFFNVREPFIVFLTAGDLRFSTHYDITIKKSQLAISN